jgi:hypothetical protein
MAWGRRPVGAQYFQVVEEIIRCARDQLGALIAARAPFVPVALRARRAPTSVDAVDVADRAERKAATTVSRCRCLVGASG